MDKLVSQLLDIATAPWRKQPVWNNEQVTWDRIVQKLKHTHRTSESYASYISSPRDRQADIKDIGGFVGGYLKDGFRRNGHVQHRQLLTLDIDNGYPDLWDDFIMYFPNAAVAYSTHKHSPAAPRLRIVMPLSRTVSVEEYEAIGRKVASFIGLKHVADLTTFEATRMMYWPSSARDGEFYYKEQTGDWLDPDDILSEYRDWRNVSEWPLCPTETEIIRTDLKKQQDPHEKEGLIGAFCRVYSVPEAIMEFIPETYSEAGGDRFTYAGSEGFAGAICYEDKFLYSHHSTDPLNDGHNHNAFDMVRIHKFGIEKESFGLMSNLARTDPKVIHELGIFNLDESITTGDTGWLDKLEAGKDGVHLPTIPNFVAILRNDPNLKGKYAYNEFDYRLYIKDKNKLREFKDADKAALRLYFEKQYKLYHVQKTKDAFDIACMDHAYHPVRDYLNSLAWDGESRLDTLFIEQLGTPDTPYTRGVTRKSLVAAVARVMEPGCKFDYMVVSIGPQGKGKSSLLYDLGKEWFSDTLDSVTGKDSYIQIQGAWLLEMGELSSIRKADVEAVKHFLTKREDRYRPPFGEYTINVKRQTVFFASTNVHEFLKDNTGNRRFWPLLVTKKYKPGSINPDQYWAEALWRYKQGEELYLSEELEAMAALQQADHTEGDDRFGVIQQFLELKLPEAKIWEDKQPYERIPWITAEMISSGKEHGHDKGTVTRNKVCAAEIYCELLGNKKGEMDKHKTKFIHDIMAQMPGWTRYNQLSYKWYGNQRSYVRIGSEYAPLDGVLVKEKEGVL